MLIVRWTDALLKALILPGNYIYAGISIVNAKRVYSSRAPNVAPI